MVQTNPIPRKTNLFVQVSVAVISGMAATYFIQNFVAVSGPARPVPQQARQVKAPEPQQAPKPVESAPETPAEPERVMPHPPVADSMMVVPEAGGAAPGVVSFDGEEPARPQAEAAAPAETRAKKKTPAGTAPKATQALRLQHRGSQSVYSGPIVGHGFGSDLKVPTFAKKEAPPEQETAPEAPKAPQPAPPPLRFAPMLIEKKAIPQKDLFVPSALHPEIVEETPFWDYERKRKAVVSGLIAATGIIYMMFALGAIGVGKRKFEDEERL